MDPARSLRISIAFLAAGLVAAGLAWALTGDTPWGDGLRLAALCFAPVAIVGGAIGAGVSRSRLRLRTRLAGGEDVVARWRVDRDTWERFLALDSALQASGGFPPNELSTPEHVAAQGVEIIVGRGAVVVGDAVHVVPERGTPEVLSAVLDESRLRLSFLELRLLHAGGDGPDVHTLLRFPVADGALGAARRAAAHFRRETPGRPDFFHGPGDGSDPEDLARCWSCGHETHKLVSRCERCGATMQSRRWARRYGAILAFLGGGLAAGMYLLLRILTPALRAAVEGRAGGAVSFNGSPTQAIALGSLLLLVFAFGVATFAYGTFQMITGRRSKRFVQGVIGLIAVVVLLGLLLAR